MVIYDINCFQLREGMNIEHRSVGENLNLDIEKKLHLENSQNHGYCFRVTRAVGNWIWVSLNFR